MAFSKLLLIVVGSIVLGASASALTAWGVTSSVLSAQGDVADQAGDAGDSGQDGSDGQPGAAGTQGKTGATGASGAPGASTGGVGPAGPQGPQGAAGAAGTSLPAALHTGPASGSAILPIDHTSVTLTSVALTPGTYVFSVYGDLVVTGLGPWDDVTCGNDLVTVYFGGAGSKVLKGGGVTMVTSTTNFDITCLAGDRTFGGGPTSTNIQVAWTDLTLYAAATR